MRAQGSITWSTLWLVRESNRSGDYTPADLFRTTFAENEGIGPYDGKLHSTCRCASRPTPFPHPAGAGREVRKAPKLLLGAVVRRLLVNSIHRPKSGTKAPWSIRSRLTYVGCECSTTSYIEAFTSTAGREGIPRRPYRARCRVTSHACIIAYRSKTYDAAWFAESFETVGATQYDVGTARR